MDEADLLNMVTVVNRDTGETFTLGDVYSQISVGVGGLNLHDLELSPQKSSSAEDTERGCVPLAAFLTIAVPCGVLPCGLALAACVVAMVIPCALPPLSWSLR